MLNPDSPIPLYRQLADILADSIREGRYRIGDRIPSENRLSEIYSIGRPTVRQAVDVLVQKKLLARKRGSGTYVRAPGEEVDLFSLAGTMSAFRKRGLDAETSMLRKIRLSKVAKADEENPFAGGMAFFFERLVKARGEPVVIETMYLHPELFRGIDRMDLAGRSLSEIVTERYYMRPSGGRQNFRIAYPIARRAKALEVDTDTPVLLVKRLLDFPRAPGALFSEIFCRTDRFVFSQSIGGLTDA